MLSPIIKKINILLQEFIDFTVEIYWLKQKYQRKGKVHSVQNNDGDIELRRTS